MEFPTVFILLIEAQGVVYHWAVSPAFLNL